MSLLLNTAAVLRRERHAIPVGRFAGEQLWATAEQTASVVGPARSGKSSGVFIPAVAVHPGPVVVTSIRPDVRDATIAARRLLAETHGGAVYELDVGDGELSPQTRHVRWDLVTGCERWATALDRATSLTFAAMTGDDDGHWRGIAAKILAGYLFAGRRAGLTDRQVAAKIDTRDWRDVLAYLAYHRATDPECYSAWLTFTSVHGEGAASPNELASGYSVLTSRPLSALRYAVSGDEFDPVSFHRSWSTIYVTVKAERAQLIASWLASFVEMLTWTWRDTPASARPVSLLLALDEVANVAPAATIPTLVTAGGGDAIQVLLGFQAPGQARLRWREDYETVLNGTSHTIIFPGLAAADYLTDQAALLGKVVAHERHIVVTDDCPQGAQFAPPDRLLAERERLEETVASLDGAARALGVDAERLALELDRERHRLGYRNRLSRPGGHLSVLEEIERFTRVELRSVTKDALTAGDIFRGRGPTSALVRSGPTAQFRDFPRHYADPLWVEILRADP